jgi:hypothetical protein
MEPRRADLRMSDADRERVVARLHAAVAEGRVTLTEFEERVAAVLKARTYGEVEPYLADLPAEPAVPVRDVVELRAHASSLQRGGRWVVPRRVVVDARAGSVKLDFSKAVITQRVVHIELAVTAGSTRLVLPDGATADVDGVQTLAGSVRARVPAAPGDGPHFIVTGVHRAGSLAVRYPFRFWRWTW